MTAHTPECRAAGLIAEGIVAHDPARCPECEAVRWAVRCDGCGNAWDTLNPCALCNAGGQSASAGRV